MSDHDDLDLLLAAERARPEPAPAVKAAVAAKVAAALGGAVVGVGVGVGVAAGARAASSAGVGVGSKVALGVLVGALAGGALVAVALPARVERVVETREVLVPSPPVLVPSPPVLVPSPPVPVPVPVPDLRPTATATATATAPRPSTTSGTDVDLSRERALIDRARSALARGDSAGALAAADEHRKVFAHGQLDEEREVVAIQALAAAGRSEEAANRAGAFRKAYPSSLLTPIVDAALRPR